MLNGEWRDDNGNLIDGNDFSVPNSNKQYWIGTNQNHGDAGRFNGCINDIGLWHELRTQEQIVADFEGGIDLTNDNLVSFWDFNNVTENVVSDLKNSNDITLMAGAKVIEE